MEEGRNTIVEFRNAYSNFDAILILSHYLNDNYLRYFMCLCLLNCLNFFKKKENVLKVKSLSLG